MDKYLIYTDENSKKFWQVHTDENKLIVTFGRIGTPGQTKETSYPTKEDAEKNAASQMAAKIKKGYAESEPPEDAPPFAPKPAAAQASAAKQTDASAPGPADVIDDGKPKPWHSEDFWEYSFYFDKDNLEIFDKLETVRDTAECGETVPCAGETPAPTADVSNEETPIPEDIFDERDDEDDRLEKTQHYRMSNMNDEELLAYVKKNMLERYNRRLVDIKDFSPEKKEDTLQSWMIEWVTSAIKRKAGRCYAYKYADPYIRTLHLLVTDDAEYTKKIQSALSEVIEEAIDDVRRSYKRSERYLEWGLANGVNILPDEFTSHYMKNFYEEYVKNPNPARVSEIFHKVREQIGAERIPIYTAELRDMINSFVDGQINGGKWSASDLCFCMKYYKIEPFGIEYPDAWHEFEFKDRSVPNDGVFQSIREPLSAALRERAEAGEFDRFAEKGLPVLRVINDDGVTLLNYMIDAEAAKSKAEEIEGVLVSLEKGDDFDRQAALLESSVPTLLLGLYAPADIERARNILRRHLYSLNRNAQNTAKKIINRFEDIFPEVQYDLGMWEFANGDISYAIRCMKEANDKGYLPAAEKITEFQAALADRSARNERFKAAYGGEVKNRKRAGKTNFLNTQTVIARAYADGKIYIRFKIEGEQGYGETLDWLNNLLDKGYARINDGYQICVRFLMKPIFIKQIANLTGSIGDSFPKNTCHAFFARAVQYPALREKIRQYAENALVLYDWYLDLDGEDNCVPGTFAACALAFADEKYIPLIGLFGRNSDDEHQYIQLLVSKPLLKQYGATPAVAAALFDINASNGQDGSITLSKDFLTDTACLKAVLEHVDELRNTNEYPHYDVAGVTYVEKIWGGKIKANLKKFKSFADGAQTPEDKNIFVDFYNFYKECASMFEGEDYGEDLQGVAEKEKITVPVYNEDSPVLLTATEAKAAGLTWDENENPGKVKLGMLFFPASIDNPELFDFVFDKQNAGKARDREYKFYYKWSKDIEPMGDWIFNPAGLAYQWGVLLFDGVNRPYVLYGILNAKKLAARNHKRPFKSPEEAESARLEALFCEPPKLPAPPTPEETAMEEDFETMLHSLWSSERWCASQLLQKYKPEHGRYYDAALVAKARIAYTQGDLEAAAVLYDEFTARRPEFADYLEKKKSALAKTQK